MKKNRAGGVVFVEREEMRKVDCLRVLRRNRFFPCNSIRAGGFRFPLEIMIGDPFTIQTCTCRNNAFLVGLADPIGFCF
jgi:hypothetical protein